MKRFDGTDILLVFIIGGVIGAVLIITFSGAGEKIEKLGSAICEEEFDMDFQSFSKGGTLVCEPGMATDSYDGLKVKLGVTEEVELGKVKEQKVILIRNDKIFGGVN